MGEKAPPEPGLLSPRLQAHFAALAGQLGSTTMSVGTYKDRPVYCQQCGAGLVEGVVVTSETRRFDPMTGEDRTSRTASRIRRCPKNWRHHEYEYIQNSSYAGPHWREHDWQTLGQWIPDPDQTVAPDASIEAEPPRAESPLRRFVGGFRRR